MAPAPPEPPDPGDRLELRGLRQLGRHGVLPEEADREQPFEVDLDLWLDTRPAAEADDLDRTVDYGAVSGLVAGVVGGRSYRLLESLADAVAREVLASDRRAAAVSVTVRKLRPPVPVQLDSAGVRVVRRREDLERLEPPSG